MKTVNSQTDIPVVIALISGPETSPSSVSRVRREVLNVDDVLTTDEGCLFTASALHFGSVKKNDPDATNFTLNIDESSCMVNSSSSNDTVV